MLQEIRYAFRSILRRPAFALSAIGLMALGIGLATAAFDLVDGLLLQAPPYDHPGRILVLSAAKPTSGLADMSLSYPEVADIRASSPSLEAVAAVRHYRALVTGGPPTTRAMGWRVSPSFFRVFGIKPQDGRPLLPTDLGPSPQRSIVLSARARQEWFGSERSALGRTLALDGVRYTVVGVMPRSFDYPTGADFWIPFVPPSTVDRASHFLSAVARIAGHSSVQDARTEIRTIGNRLAQAYPATDGGWQIRAMSLKASRVGDDTPEVAVAGVGAVLVLLIACANVASLLLARAATREGEIGVRRALGATAARLMREVLAESLLLAAFGALVGAGSADAVAGLLRRAVPGPVPAWVSFSVRPPTLGFVAASVILATLLAGIAPAAVVVRRQARISLGGHHTGSRQQQRMRRGVVVAQVALAAVLLAGAGLLGESLLRLRSVSPGFDARGVTTAHVTLTGPGYDAASARERFYSDVLARLRSLPGVRAAGAIDELPLASGIDRFTFTLEGEPKPPEGSEPVARDAVITPGLLTSLHIPLLRGRDFTQDDGATRQRVALVSASWARKFVPGRNALGQQFRTSDGNVTTIVGVVGDVRHDDLQTAGEPTVYTPLAQGPMFDMTLVVRGACDPAGSDTCDDGAALIPMVRRAMTRTDPEAAAYDLETMDAIVNQSLSSNRVAATLGVTLALLALALAAAGVYGLMALHLALRRRDVAIRLALGARPQSLRWHLLGEGIRLAAIGTALGLAIVALGGRVLSSLLYGVNNTDAGILLLTAVLATGVGLLASLGPAVRAARISPAEALRSE